MPSSTRLRIFATLLWLVLIVVGWWSWQRLGRQRAVDAVCDAVAREAWDEALAASDTLPTDDAVGRRAAECRALALMASSRVPDAVTLLEEHLAEPANESWLPDPVLVLLLADDRRNRGQMPSAVELVRDATSRYPDDPDLLYLELELRAQVEDEGKVLEELENRLATMGDAAPWLALRVAQRHLDRRDLGRAARLLGPGPPGGNPALRDEWFRVRAALAGSAGDTADLATVCASWLAAGGRPAEVLAWHALSLSIYQLEDPERPTPILLRSALDHCEEIPDPGLCATLAHRLLGTYVVAGRTEDALALWDRWSPKVELTMGREEILRAADDGLETSGDDGSPGRIRFTLPAGTGRYLLLSPPTDVPVDQPFEEHRPDATGRVEVRRFPGPAPLRWVLRDTARTLASGSTWPVPGQVLDVVLDVVLEADTLEPAGNRSANAPTTTPESALGGPADGRRQIVVTILDCADWRLLRYLEARGELPTFHRLLGTGLRAVVESRPAFTAAAMDALSHPADPARRSPLAVVHQLGIELAANSFVGNNPFDSLAWLIPERRDFFTVLGAGEHVVVNLLFSEGRIDGGRHGERVGPRGERSRFEDWRRRRALTPDERKSLAHLLDDPNRRLWIEEMAADFDTAEQVARDGEVDLLMLRIDPLDPATHSGFGPTATGGRDDGAPWIYDFYRYADRRLGDLAAALDGDDILVILSDHGIRTSMEHSPWAVFLAVGEGVPQGRVGGTPPLRAVPRLLADWLGVTTDWPRAEGRWRPMESPGDAGP